jgi:hypothetical protein
MEDVSFITVNDAPSTMIGLRVVDFTRSCSMRRRKKQFLTINAHTMKSFN